MKFPVFGSNVNSENAERCHGFICDIVSSCNVRMLNGGHAKMWGKKYNR